MPPTDRLRALRAPLAVGALGAGAFVALAVRDPHVAGSWGSCAFLGVTGHWCPGCGGLRAVNDLAHLDVGAALSSNAAAVLLAAGLAVWWVVWTWSRARGVPVRWQRYLNGWTVGAATALWVVFAVVRNLPGFEALGPAPV
ncbi:hypothetical protein GCM10028777_25940 [Angustibacter speluncae]